LYPCGRENILFFPPLNATDYRLVLSNCQLEESSYYMEALSVTVSAHATVQVSWNPTASDESVVAHVRAEMDLALAVDEFARHQPKEVPSKDDFDLVSQRDAPPGVPFCLDDSQCSSRSSAGDPMVLLERLQTQMEKDRQAVDRILTTMGVIAVALLGCLFKMMWEPHLPRKRPTEVRFSTPASTHFLHRGGATPRRIEHGQPNGNDGILHSPSWKTSLIFRTPPPAWEVPETAPASESTLTPGVGPLRSASSRGGDQSLAVDWRRRQEERRRKRANALNSQQRLVPPTPEDLLSMEEPSSEATTVASTVIATQSSLDDETLTDADRKQMARSLWSFGC
jgi:hypothetical protein